MNMAYWKRGLVVAALALAVLVAARARTVSRASVTAPSPEPHAASTTEVHIDGGPFRLRGILLTPAGAGPFRAILYNHGSEKDPSMDYEGDLARWFQERGYVVLFPYRRGASGSEGPYWQDHVDALPPEQREAATIHALEDENTDVLVALAWLKRQAVVDGARIAVAGCSFGGIESLLTTEASSTPFAILDFAGASMMWSRSPLLRERLTKAAQGAHAPVFFLQAKNDFDTTPSLVLSETMTSASKPNEVHIFPAHGTTHMQGHAGFCNHGMEEWGPRALRFLDETAAAPAPPR